MRIFYLYLYCAATFLLMQSIARKIYLEGFSDGRYQRILHNMEIDGNVINFPFTAKEDQHAEQTVDKENVTNH